MKNSSIEGSRKLWNLMLRKSDNQAFTYSPIFVEQDTLAGLQKGERAKIIQIESPTLLLALIKIGIMEGDEIQLTDLAPWGDPLAIAVNGTKITLRKADATQIRVEKI